MAEKKINYFARQFADVRGELINYVRHFYPELYQDFNDASIGMMLIELNAAVSDMLSYHTDKMFTETQIDYAQERRSVMNIARTLGLKIPGRRSSITLVDFSVVVPVFGDTFDVRYAPTIKYGTQVAGAGQTFETLDDIDFSSPFSTGGIPNRLIIPNINANNQIVSYTLVKREIVSNGISKIYKKIITDRDAKPFLEIILPDNNVVSIEQAITKEGTTFINNPTTAEFVDNNLRWWEVDSLAEDKIFVEDPNRSTDNTGIKPGKWMSVNRKFVKEYTDTGFCKITFGSGFSDQQNLQAYTTNQYVLQVSNFFNSTALGEIPRPNTTLYVRYRVGGGTTANIGANVINSVGFVDMFVNGPNTTNNQAVRQSLRVNNPIPAFGGGDEPTIDEIRWMTKYNFASQNRAVTIKDYIATIFKMPGKFGVPFRMQVAENQNKVEFAVLGLNSQGKLDNSSTNTLKENMSTWLADYRMINDYVLIRDGKVINLAFDIDLYTDKSFNQAEIVNNVINTITSYFDVNKWQMGQNIYISQLIEQINNVAGVLNITDIKAYNKVGGNYSLNFTRQSYIDNVTKQIDLTLDYVLFGEYDTMFEIKYPQTDIRVRVKS
ncbi:MAG: hypothetical protein ACK5OW_01265 [bacterium]